MRNSAPHPALREGVRGARITALLFAVIVCTPAYAERYTITLDGFAFKPATLQVKVGDEIEWVNKDIVEHTATARDGAFDSKVVKPGASWRWKATKAGSHPYFCALHLTMTASIEVK